MLSLGPLSFAHPVALFGFAVLAVIWWFLRLTPPAPKRVVFPPVRLLSKLIQKEESPARTPWWLLLLRLAMASAIILSVAHPLLDARTQMANEGPVYIVLDNDWSSAKNWEKRRQSLIRLADQAERQNRSIAFVSTAPSPSSIKANDLSFVSAAEARKRFGAVQPKPWATDRQKALDLLAGLAARSDVGPGQVYWLSNGIEEAARGSESSLSVEAFTEALAAYGAVAVMASSAQSLPLVIRDPQYKNGFLSLTVSRQQAQQSRGVFVKAFGDEGQVFMRQAGVFKSGEQETVVDLRLPSEQFNRLTRVEVEGANQVGAVVLFDERWRRRPIGIVSFGTGVAVQPLLREQHYLARALEPYTEVREGTATELLKRELALLVLADPGTLAPADTTALSKWVADGGMLVRFAGPKLAQSGGDPEKDLLPVLLRAGDREIGGAMSWGKPATLAPFDEDSPFYGLTVTPEVTVQKQVLASPSLDLAEKTWARLSDGTPLVTAEKRGNGWTVLFHTTANAEWSNLVLSGQFVEMLQRIVNLSQGVSGSGEGPPLVPIETLNGFGVSSAANGEAQAIEHKNFDKTVVSADHPPGVYGAPGSRRVLNLSTSLPPLLPIQSLPATVQRMDYDLQAERDLRPWLLMLALVLFVIDSLASLALRGVLVSRRAFTALAGFIIITTGDVGPSYANEDFARANSLETRLAYVISGNDQVDQTTELGLRGLNRILRERTAAELGPPQGIDPGVDDLHFFPLIYWPIVEGYRLPNDLTAQRVRNFLRGGGTILFDTRDRSGGAGLAELREMAVVLNLPPLVPVPRDHVLTRSFYLLDGFPGRWAGEGVWIEKAGERVNDGVASVISGSHDWAAAWAEDEEFRPLYPVVPGGERQRELAYRFGVNLVMYTLTGNYKSDQVHLPAILERIGQ